MSNWNNYILVHMSLEDQNMVKIIWIFRVLLAAKMFDPNELNFQTKIGTWIQKDSLKFGKDPRKGDDPSIQWYTVSKMTSE